MSPEKSSGLGSQHEKAPEIRKAFFLSRGDSTWLFFVVVLVAGLVWYGFYATHTREIAGSDDREYASIARNIVQGKGIVRNLAYPVDIHFFEKLPIPEFVHPPGYPLILAGFFKLFGLQDWVGLLPSSLSYFLLVVLLFFFAKKVLGPQKAVLAALILIFNKEILNVSLVALSEGTYTLLFFLFFIVFIRASSLKALGLAGLLLGLSHLVRENIYPFIFPLLIYLYFFPDLPRGKKWAFFMGGLLIPIVANMVRSLLDTGSPFFSYGKFALMAFTEKYPWLNVYRGLENPSLFEFLLEEPGIFVSKYVTNFVQTLEGFLSISNAYVLAFFLIEMFDWKTGPEWKRMKTVFLFLLLFQILFIPLFTFTHRFFIPFLPLVVMFASRGLWRTAEELISAVKGERKRKVFYLTLLLFFLFFMLPAVYTIFHPHHFRGSGYKTPQYGFLIPQSEVKKLNDFLRNELKESQVIWSDLPEVLEWEGDRLCGWLPTGIEMIYEIHKKIPVDAILLTNIRTPYQMEEEWRYLLFSEHSLPRYRNVKLYRAGRIYAKLLIRDERE